MLLCIATLHLHAAEECDHIISIAQPRMDRSGVVDTSTGKSKIDDIRTSTGTFLQRGEDPIIAGVAVHGAAGSLAA